LLRSSFNKDLEHVETNKDLEHVETNKDLEHVETNKDLEHVETNKGLEHVETNKGLEHVETNKGLEHVETNKGLEYALDKYADSIFLSHITRNGKTFISGSGTHNFFIDLYKNFSIYSFLMIILPLILIVYLAYKRNIDPCSRDLSNAKLIFAVVLFTTIGSFIFSSYLSRNILFPLLISVSYFIASIKKDEKS
jgi:hypothetical protein